MNVSTTYTDECSSPDGKPPACTPADFINTPGISPEFDRTLHTLNWKQHTAAQWDRFPLLGSGGNQGGTQGALLYPALEEGLFMTPFTMATASDPLLRVAGAGSTAGPALEQRSAKDALDLIARTAIAVPTVPNLIDAYAAMLELDRGSTTMVIHRLAIHRRTATPARSCNGRQRDRTARHAPTPPRRLANSPSPGTAIRPRRARLEEISTRTEP